MSKKKNHTSVKNTTRTPETGLRIFTSTCQRADLDLRRQFILQELKKTRMGQRTIYILYLLANSNPEQFSRITT